MNINRMISNYNFTRYTSRKIQYIVIHWVGAVSKAKNNAQYFAGGDRRASAHYFVDDHEIWQSVEDKNTSWNCGGGLQGSGGHKYHNICGNSNSIGIEMCLDKAGHISDKTIVNTAWLVQYLIKKYGIPASNVIRHYDVTGKDCPAPYCYKNDSKWPALHSTLVGAKATAAPTAATTTKPAAVAIPKPVLRKGSKGTAVKQLQTCLNKLGAKLAVDGSWGLLTDKAFERWQITYKLKPDRSYGPLGYAKMQTLFK